MIPFPAQHELDDRETPSDAQPGNSTRAGGTPFRRIVVAVDGSRYSAGALRLAMTLAGDRPSAVTLVHVVEISVLLEPGLSVRPDLYDGRLRAERAMLDAVRRSLPAGSEVATLLREGDPGEEIAGAARELGADLIVLGHHRRGRVAEVLRCGGVTVGVLRAAPCPVLIACHADEGTDRAGCAAASAASATSATSAASMAGAAGAAGAAGRSPVPGAAAGGR